MGLTLRSKCMIVLDLGYNGASWVVEEVPVVHRW